MDDLDQAIDSVIGQKKTSAAAADPLDAAVDSVVSSSTTDLRSNLMGAFDSKPDL